MILLFGREISWSRRGRSARTWASRSPAFGNLLDDAVVVAQCLEALKWRGVLLFRGLNLTDEAQVAFSRKLGELVSPGGQEIFKVSLDPTVNPVAEYRKGTFHWHMDGTSDSVPQKATTLTARHVAMVGGQTEFATTYAAYNSGAAYLDLVVEPRA
jgi:alpha-ketoglutarate-dependent taurine dioxygenase